MRMPEFVPIVCAVFLFCLQCAPALAGDDVASLSKYSGKTQVERGGKVNEVFKIGSDYTDLQRDKLFGAIRGKTVVWDCEVYEVSAGPGKDMYTITSNQEDDFVPCIIYLTARSQKEIEQVEKLKTGSKIRITGIVDDITFRHLEIRPAVFSDPDPAGSSAAGNSFATASSNAGTPGSGVNEQPVGKGGPYNENALRESYSQCMDRSDGITVKMKDCLNAETEYWDARLNSAYKELMARLDPDARKILLQAERSWIVYREKYVSMEGAGGGSAGGLNAGSLYLMETMKQALLLEGSLAPYK